MASAEWQTFEHAYQEADRLYSIFVDRVLDRLDRGDDLVAGGRERA